MSDHRPVFVILGATGGVGSALVERLAPTSDLVLGGRSREKANALASAHGAEAIALDARDPSDVQRAVDMAMDVHGRLDGIANCVGSLLLKPAHATKPEEWDDVIATNLRSAYGTVRAAAPAMRKTGGSIVLVSSAAARTGLANHEAIAAAKAGVNGLMRSAAASYANWNVRVNAVAPGLTRTPMTDHLTSIEASAKASEAMHALGRLGESDDIASLIAWLLDPANAWITGQVIGVDGGLSTVRPR